MEPLVGIIIGSDSDLGVMSKTAEILDKLEIPYEFSIISAHRTPDRMYEYARQARKRGLKAIIAGAGGAATAIEIQAALDGVKEISIFNIHDKFWANAEETVKKINERTDCKATLYDLDDKEKLREEMADSFIFVNGTGVGMKPLEGMSVVPDKSFFRPELIVVDVPYSPLETTMRKMAKEVGCKTMNGLGMMLFQGAAAFKLWTGKDMPIEHMKEVLNIRYDD